MNRKHIIAIGLLTGISIILGTIALLLPHYNRYSHARLLVAVENGNLATARKWSSLGAEVNTPDWGNAQYDKRGCPLEIAVRNSDSQMVKLLLNRGAFPGELIAEARNVEVVKLLVGAGGEWKKWELELLSNACRDGNHKLLKYLFELGCDAKAVSNNSLSPLHYAALSNSTECCQILIDTGVDVNSVSSFTGSPALYHALSNEKIEAAYLLMDAGARTDHKSFDDLVKQPFCRRILEDYRLQKR